MTSLIPAPVELEPSSADLAAWRAGFETDEARASTELIAERAGKAEESVHAPKTRKSYDYWWERFVEWLNDPDKRTVGRPWPSTPLPFFKTVATSETGDDLIFAWLSELVYGPESSTAHSLWLEDGGTCSPNTLSMLVSALKARISRLLGSPWVPGSDLADRLTGMRAHCREHYGSDVQAYALLSKDVITIARYLAAVDDIQILRDRLVLELTVAGVSAAEIARCPRDAVREPEPGIQASSPEAIDRLWSEGIVGARVLVLPGQGRRGGNTDPARYLVLDDHAPLTTALDAYMAARTDAEPWLLAGIGAENRRACVREMLIGIGRPVGWWPAADDPAPDAVTAARIRSEFDVAWSADVRRRRRDLAMLWIGYLLALRRSELLNLTVADVRERVEGHHRRIIRVYRTKTDRQRKGVKLALDGVTDERRGTHLDPVAALVAWLKELDVLYGGKAPSSAPLFPALDRSGQILERAGKRCVRMTDQAWSDRLRLHARRVRCGHRPRRSRLGLWALAATRPHHPGCDARQDGAGDPDGVRPQVTQPARRLRGGGAGGARQRADPHRRAAHRPRCVTSRRGASHDSGERFQRV